MTKFSARLIYPLLIVLMLVGGGWVFARRLTIGTVHGRPVRLYEWFNSNTRLQLQVAKSNQKLEACLELPLEQQLFALLQLEQKYGEVFLSGDRIRTAIVATGQEGSLPAIRRWLKTEPHLGQRALIHGTREALRSRRATDRFKVQVFQILLAGLDGHDDWSGDAIPALLLKLDPARGERVLKSPEYLNPDYESFDDILNAFSATGVILPRSMVESWLPRWNKADLSYGEVKTAVEVLKALAFHDEAAADAGLYKLVLAKTEASSVAAEVLLEMRELPHPRFQLSDKAEKNGGASLNAHERAAWLVERYNYAIDCGGLVTFEHDEVGNFLPEIIAALREVRSDYNARRLEAFCALFGPGGPPRDLASRSQYVTSRGEDWIDARDGVHEAFTEFEDTEWLLLKYVLDHPNHFDKVPRREIESEDEAE
ncbi:DUF4375 domain-containing protein [Verrucomicrobium sp. BvORR106]|uniref:DMP19 family protein n=1 Tax=Verrucomicrobium sp. BvORR106 TaxID=1403819 RepID=UPI00056F775B|nr:DUF4375 domain-containing protein [Verrucomicrobium sp. BvORR106]